MMGFKRWQLVVLLLIGSVLFVRSHKHEEESGFEEDGGEDDHKDHFDEEGHKGEKGYHKKVMSMSLGIIGHFFFQFGYLFNLLLFMIFIHYFVTVFFVFSRNFQNKFRFFCSFQRLLWFD